jgi:hypothetical protein
MNNDYNKEEDIKDFDIEDTPDISGVVEAIREAWLLVPNMSLSQLLDEATPSPFCELTSTELIEALNEFILQNQ